jgi:ATP-dependent DNA ligase
MPPVAPMLAKSVESIPEGEGMVFEPKWDGFRCIVFRDGDEIVLGSRNERPLTRYFPELVERLLQVLPPHCVVDGEIVVAGPDGLDFDALQQRIHPAESRVKRLSEETPASFVAFDLLALDDRDLMAEPLTERQALLAGAIPAGDPMVHLTPATTDRSVAADWFVRFEGAGLDGVMAKPPGGRYEPNKRVQFKVKHKRTADCVVAGFRMHKDGDGVGSLLLGLYDDEGQLHHVGVASSFTARRRKELLAELAPHLEDALDTHP